METRFRIHRPSSLRAGLSPKETGKEPPRVPQRTRYPPSLAFALPYPPCAFRRFKAGFGIAHSLPAVDGVDHPAGFFFLHLGKARNRENFLCQTLGFRQLADVESGIGRLP